MMQVPVTVSIIIEWENATRIGAARALAMLERLQEQIVGAKASGGWEFELLLLHHSEQGVPAEVAAAFASFDEIGVSGRLIALDTSDYYRQKNAGADHATGELALFLDSDVIPRSGWLEKMLAAMRDPGVALVGGSTTIEGPGWYDRAMALTWIFPIPNAGRGLQPSTFFYANNFIVRSHVFAANRFPDTRQFRGQCSALADQLVSKGLTMRMHHAAIVGHPPPLARHLLQRGYLSGGDLLTWLKMSQPKGAAWRGTKIVAHDLLSALRQIREHAGGTGIGLIGGLGAALLAAVYNAARYLGFWVHLAAPVHRASSSHSD